MATFNNHPYKSSSKFSANWRATVTYAGTVVEYWLFIIDYLNIIKICIIQQLSKF